MPKLGHYVVISILASPHHPWLTYVKYICNGLNFAEKNIWGLRPLRVPKLGTLGALRRSHGTKILGSKGPGTLKTGTIFAKPSTNRALSKVWFKDICNRCPFEV
jgi:hypothetical protein